jgi:hypothetical protein
MTTVTRRNPTRREIAGRIDSREIQDARRRMWLWILGASGTVTIYSAVVFLRVDELAKRLPDWATGFPTLVAALFTLLTLAALVLLSVWAANRSSLREAKDAIAPVVADTHDLVRDLQESAEEGIEASRQAAEAAITKLAEAESIVQEGQNQVVRYVQKANLLLGQSVPILPLSEHLGPFARVERDLTTARLDETDTIITSTRSELAIDPDFTVDEPVDNPWEPRTRERGAIPSREFVDPARLQEP